MLNWLLEFLLTPPDTIFSISGSILRLKIFSQFFLHFFFFFHNNFFCLLLIMMMLHTWGDVQGLWRGCCPWLVRIWRTNYFAKPSILLLRSCSQIMQTKLQRLDYWLIMCRAKNIFATWWGRGILCSQPCSGCQGCCNPCVKSYFQLCFARIICFRCQKMHKRTEVKIFISKLIEYCFLLWRKMNKKTEQKSNGLTSVLRIQMGSPQY